jgi:hypothetical protein
MFLLSTRSLKCAWPESCHDSCALPILEDTEAERSGINPTPASSLVDSTADFDFVGNGKPVVTVTATRIGTARYFHPGLSPQETRYVESSQSPTLASTTTESTEQTTTSREQDPLLNELSSEGTNSPFLDTGSKFPLEPTLEDSVPTLSSFEPLPEEGSSEFMTQDTPRPTAGQPF